MKRLEVIQTLLNATGGSTYLEIGVCHGTVFLPVRAPRKIAVDPNFLIPWTKKMRHPGNFIRSSYFEMPSDLFFNNHADLFKSNPINVAFVDGLHTYKQSLRDVEHCLEHLAPNGVIVMHDCNPETAAAALPTMEEAQRISGKSAWCGDVWKTIVHLRSMRPDLKVCVLDCDHGLGIVVRGEAEKLLAHSLETIGNLGYEELAARRAEWLNLKPPEYLREIWLSVSQASRSGGH